MSLSDDELKKLRERLEIPSTATFAGWVLEFGGQAAFKATFRAIIDEALSRGARLEQCKARDMLQEQLEDPTFREVFCRAWAEEDLLTQRDEARAALAKVEAERDALSKANAALQAGLTESAVQRANARAVVFEEAAEALIQKFIAEGGYRSPSDDKEIRAFFRALSSSPPSGQWVAVSGEEWEQMRKDLHDLTMAARFRP